MRLLSMRMVRVEHGWTAWQVVWLLVGKLLLLMRMLRRELALTPTS